MLNVVTPVSYTHLDVYKRQIPMSMEDWVKQLNVFLEFNGNQILTDAGKISAEQAKLYVEKEFEKYRIVWDGIFPSDQD